MRSWSLSVFFCLACLVCVPAYAGTPDGASAGSEDGAPAPQAEEAKPLFRIAFADGRLSVELVDAGFGDVMKAIAAKSGIKVEISSGVYAKKVTTSFRGLGLERGLSRLLALVQEKNYLIRYDSAGAVSKVEIYGSGTAPSATAGPDAAAPAERRAVPASTVPAGSMPRIRKNPPASRRILPPFGEKEAVRPKPEPADEPANEEGYKEETPSEPSEKVPAYIPPRVPQD